MISILNSAYLSGFTSRNPERPNSDSKPEAETTRAVAYTKRIRDSVERLNSHDDLTSKWLEDVREFEIYNFLHVHVYAPFSGLCHYLFET